MSRLAPIHDPREPEADAAGVTPQAQFGRRVAGVVLAGGRSSRMGGRDKAFLRVGDQFVIRRTIELLRQCFADVVVVSNQLEKFRDYDIVVTADEFPGCGPLAGIHAAMGIVSQPYVFVIACDMPFVQGPVIEYLVRRLTEQDALIPCWEDDIEPLHGLYATRLRPQIEDALRGGVTAIRSFLPTIRTEFVTESEMQGVPGAYESFLNINTPEDAAKFDLRLGAVLDERR